MKKKQKKKKQKKLTKAQILKKQASRQALPTRPPPSFIAQAVEDAKKARTEPQADDDKIIATGSESDFWKLIKGYIERANASLKKQTTEAVVQSGYKLEEAGFRFLITDQLTNYGEDIIKYVEGKAAVMQIMKRQQQEKEKAKAEKEAKKKQR